MEEKRYTIEELKDVEKETDKAITGRLIHYAGAALICALADIYKIGPTGVIGIAAASTVFFRKDMLLLDAVGRKIDILKEKANKKEKTI